MDMTALKIYMVVLMTLMMVYAVRHFIFSYSRIFGRQRLYYNDILSGRMPRVSVLIPMHNEEQVLHNVLESLLVCDYDRDRLEIIPVNDHSSDRTEELLNEYSRRCDCIRPLHRYSGLPGKPAALNDAMERATGDVVIVFDADYRPARDMLKQLAIAFADPEVGAVMGRVIPYNANRNTLTRLMNLERSGGYQVDQQARYNLRLVPQYGGTVGGFRRDLFLESGGFNTSVLAEDTELTYRFFTSGWKVIYANSAECYEEAPETWTVRGRQIRRWSRGHNNVMFRYLGRTLTSRHMNLREKVDGILLLLVYAMPLLLALGMVVALILFFSGEMAYFGGWWVLFFLGLYSSFGNFAPFYEIGTAQVLDGTRRDVLLLPLILFNFYFYMWHISRGFIDAVLDLLTGRDVRWAKTRRFSQAQELSAETPQ